MLQHLGLIDAIPPWYSSKKVDPYMEGEDVKFWWDTPEYNGRDEEEIKSNRSRPDGKIILTRNNEKCVYLIEMTVPWTGNREAKYVYKAEKYIDVQSNLKLEYPGYKIDQITLVMDVFGGYDKELRNNIAKVIDDQTKQNNIIRNMQKSIISSVANISRLFKVRVK